jgi:hypothetical protein
MKCPARCSPAAIVTSALALIAVTSLLAFGIPSAAAAPDTDDRGFIDSAARCTTPDVAVAFGKTQSARVAICKTPAGGYEYRGVRTRDGAKLIIPASRSDNGAFIADNDGVTYAVTSKALLVSAGDEVISRESMVEFHEPGTSAAPTETSATTAPTTTTPGASPTETSTSTPPPTTTTSETPLPPPLPAEVGGGSGDH